MLYPQHSFSKPITKRVNSNELVLDAGNNTRILVAVDGLRGGYTGKERIRTETCAKTVSERSVERIVCPQPSQLRPPAATRPRLVMGPRATLTPLPYCKRFRMAL
jgi:hypothetical protein